MIHIDFETRSRVDIKKTGAWKYAQDPSTEVLCMAYCLDVGGVPQLWTPDHAVDRHGFFGRDVDNNLFVAHNAGFERAIWSEIMVKRYGFPEIPIENWRCSAAKAGAHALPRALADACGALALPMQKDSEGRAVMMKLCKPRKPTKNNPSEWHDDPADFERLYQYCLQDVRAEIDLFGALPNLSTKEQHIWEIDQIINSRGVRVDMPTIHAAIQLIEEYNKELTAELQELTDGIVGASSERDKMLEWFLLNGLELDTLRKGDVSDLLAEDLPAHVKHPEKVRRALQIRQQLSKTSTAKYFAIREAVCQDGRLRDLLLIYGASTGRWAGKGPQPQNLPRNTGILDIETCVTLIRQRNLAAFRLCYEDPMEALSMMLRAMFIASPGKTMIGGDYAGIEARVLFWLAGESKGLQMFRDDEDIYVAMAQVIYEKEIISKAERQLGKTAILGLGFGMGAKKFLETCDMFKIEVPKHLYSITKNEKGEESVKCAVVDKYREMYAPVVRFWYDQENAAIEATRHPGTMVTCGRIKWRTANGFLYCRLPSGRCLAYCHPKVEVKETPWGAKKETLTFMAVNPKTKNWERQKTYGGALAENITQAVARDLMAEAMIGAHENGYDILLTVHDELIAEDTFVDEEQFKSIMEDLPDWAEGLPVKVEVWSGTRYEK